VRGLALVRPDGSRERIGCGALVLACNGYGGNRDLVREHIPTLADALYFGHPGNPGRGHPLGARAERDDAPSLRTPGPRVVAEPGGILITWATITEGGVQVNAEGRRFSNEAYGLLGAGRGRSSSSREASPGPSSTSVSRRSLGSSRISATRSREASCSRPQTRRNWPERTRLPSEALAATLAEVAALKASGCKDAFGRDFAGVPPLRPPFKAVRVTGALFHTQGGLVVDERTRVLTEAGTPLPNLFAAGGAACGVSGSKASGYLSGNGLLTAIVLGRIAGRAAATLAA
jgi:fumarate reductase flavoprotein subunit